MFPTVRVAVLGLYSSGSTATATMLHHLGVGLGREFFADNYEPRWLAEQLRDWWQEPELVEAMPRPERVRVLAEWIEDLEVECDRRRSMQGTERHGGRSLQRRDVCGAKHPLLTLCGPDLVGAWGPETKFIRCWRPLEESIASLARRGWWPGREEAIQRRLWHAAEQFFAGQAHLRVEFSDVLCHPEQAIERLIDFLGMEPTAFERAAAAGSITRREQPRVIAALSP